MFAETSQPKIDPKRLETTFTLTLDQGAQWPIELDFSENPNVLLELEDSATTLQAGILINQDASCWLTNLGDNGSLEVFRPEKSIYRSLNYNQVAYLQHRDYLGVRGVYFQLIFYPSKVFLQPVARSELTALKIH